MAALKDAPEQKKARTKPLKAFNKAVSALEDRIEEDQLDIEIERALTRMIEAY